MEYFIAICGFLGGWLLVAGPVYQAGLELEEESIDRDSMNLANDRVPPPPQVSRWWWFLPPVLFVLERRRSREFRSAVMATLDPDEQVAVLSFLNKANGWLLVAGGALLIAVKETWELIELLHWPAWIFWVLVVLLPFLALFNAMSRSIRTQRTLHPDDVRPPPRRRPARSAAADPTPSAPAHPEQVQEP